MSPVRACEDIDEQALSYAEIKALCAGNPLIKEKMDLDIEVARLKLLKSDHQNQHYRLQDNVLKKYPEEIKAFKGYIEGTNADIARLSANTQLVEDGIPEMLINGKAYIKRGEAGEALLEAIKAVDTSSTVKIGSYRGFDLQVQVASGLSNSVVVYFTLRGNLNYQVSLGDDALGNITRINNVLGELPKRLQDFVNGK